MTQRTLCMMCESIGPQASISKIALRQVEAALAAGWRVTVLANNLHRSLQPQVEWLKVYVPPRGFAFQWLTGRHWIKKAIGKRKFDVMHGHQPQTADLCDVYQCHFSTRAAYKHHCLFDDNGLKGVADAIQKRVVLQAEDWFYEHWNEKTLMVFVSELLRTEFSLYYGLPPREVTLENPVPEAEPFTSEQRQLAREHYFGHADDRIVIGYLGGMQARKGYKPLLDAVALEPDIHLLFGGQDTERAHVTGLPRVYPIGSVSNLDQFYATCDMVIVPSVFDPCPVVVVEAISRSIPVIVAAGVGNLNTLLSFGAGLCWAAGEPLGPVVRQIITNRSSFENGANRFARARSESNYIEQMHNLWESVLASRR